MSDNKCPHCGMDVTEYARIEKRSAEFFYRFGRIIKALLIILAFYLMTVSILACLGYL